MAFSHGNVKMNCTRQTCHRQATTAGRKDVYAYSDYVRNSQLFFVADNDTRQHAVNRNVFFGVLINQLDALISQIYFWNKTLHVSDSSSTHQEFFTVHTAMIYVYVIQLASRIRTALSSVLTLLASCQQTCMTYTIAVCTVKNYWWWTEELSETCRVLFQK